MKNIFDLLDKLQVSGIRLRLDDSNNLLIRGNKKALDQELIDEIKKLKPDLVEYLLQNRHMIIEVVENRNNGNLRTSFAQRRLWLLDQIDGGSAQYNMSCPLKLTGALSVDVVNKVFTAILGRHESLRTCFAAGDDGEPIQIIQTAEPFVVPTVDLSALEESVRQRQLAELMAEESGRVFDLSQDLMLRALLIKLAEKEHIALVTMHHIASDGWSMSIFINEFSALYSAYSQGKGNPLAPLPIQYGDYAHWQRNWLQGRVLDQQLGYWEKQLAGLPVVHSLPLDHLRPSAQTFVGKTYISQIDKTTGRELNNLCEAQGATLFMGLQAAFAALLSRYSNETDIVMGSPIANREQAEIAGLIGFFANTLVLRSDLSGNPTFIELLQRSRNMLLEAYAHQQVPFEEIVEKLQPERNESHSPLFQVMLILQNNEEGVLELPGLKLSPVELNTDTAKYDITLDVTETEQGLLLSWEYNIDLFDHKTIARMAMHFEILLKALLAKPEQSVFKAEMLSARERHQLLEEWNNTATGFAEEKCIHEFFEMQAETNPHAIAVTFEGRQLSYGELNEKSNRLAHYLMGEKQITPESLVGICIERSPDMVVGILATLKAGGAYVPLDPEYPEARLAYMLDDAKPGTVLTQTRLREKIPVSEEQTVCLDDEVLQQQLQQQPVANPDGKSLGLTSNHLAYVIYTSGSTGKPKGVLAPHRSIVNRVSWMEKHFPSREDDVFCQKTAFGFVDHVAEIFQALSHGRHLAVVRTDDTLDPERFIDIVGRYRITRLTLVPSLLKVMIEQGTLAAMPSLRLVISSGEALQLEETRSFYRALPTTRLLNLYGSSEVGADVSAYLIETFDENPEVMQYFLDPVSLDGDSDGEPPEGRLTHQSPGSIIDNPEFRAQYSDSTLPQHAVDYQSYVNELSESVLPFSVDVAAQRYIGHMTSKLPSFIPELSRLITQLNQNMVKVETSNNLTLIERQVLAIMHRLFFRLPKSFYDAHCQDPSHVFGMVTGGGSVANLTSLWCARNRGLLALGYSQEEINHFGAHNLLQQKGYKGAVILGTRLMHYSMRKSAAVMGLGEAGIMYVARDATQKMSVMDLQRCIEHCRQNQLFIIAVVGIAGATETGTIDPLDKIAPVAQQHGIHFHVDAAWGGAFQLSQQYRHLLSGIEQADSIIFCPHKQLYLSQGMSLCLLRDTQSAASIATHASYQSQKGSYDLGQYSVEGSRPAHALLLHASLHLLGQSGYSWLIEQSMSKTRYFTSMVKSSTCFELIGQPDLNVINYRYIPVALRSRSSFLPAENTQISESVTKIQQQQFASGRSFVSKTTLRMPNTGLSNTDGEPIVVFRIVLSNPLTRFDDLREVLAEQLRIANELIEDPVDHHQNQLQSLSGDMASAYAKWQVPIGKPIANTQLMVLDSNTNLVPPGVCGELHVGGLGLARGYLNRAELTDEKFIPNPFHDKTNPASSERLYKTGDLVRWLPDGNLEFVGRIDQQVKVRGFRIELGEIENALGSHPQVKDAVVVAKENLSGDKQLYAYVVPRHGDDSEGDARAFSLFYFGADTDSGDNKYELYLKAAKFADEQGFEAVWTPERHFDPVGGLYPNPSILGAALATTTSRVKIRAGSVVLPFHDPIRIAEEWAVVDNLSHGRVGIATTSGWHIRDFVLAPENYGDRKNVLQEGIDTIKSLWQGKKITRKDGKGEDVEVQIFPQPVQKQIPLWITAAGNPETFVQAGRLGANLLTNLLGQSIEELAEKIVLYRETLAKHGHDPEQGRVTLMIHTYLGEDPRQTLDEARGPFKKYMRSHISLIIPMLKSLGVPTDDLDESGLENMVDFAFERYAQTASFIGTPESVAGVAARLEEIGVDEFACLIDWMDSTSAMKGLEFIRQLQEITRSLPPSSRVLGDYCRNLLPRYMVPSGFVLMNKLPLSPNGKVDRKALPDPDLSAEQAAYQPPRNDTEKQLCEIWQEILGVERVGIADNFFELGGSSLSATRLIARINQRFNVQLEIKALFQCEDLSALGNVIVEHGILDKNKRSLEENRLKEEIEW